MKRKLIIAALFILFTNLNVAMAQMDSTAKDAILTLLLSKSVSEKIFVDYPDGRWRGAFDLPGGNYVFIPPNSTLRSVYPTILDEMPYTTRTDGLLNMRTLYRDSVQGIFITQIPGPELFTLFEQIRIVGNSAQINFFTTSRYNEEQYNGRYIRVKSQLVRVNNEWGIAELNVEPIEWTDFFK